MATGGLCFRALGKRPGPWSLAVHFRIEGNTDGFLPWLRWLISPPIGTKTGDGPFRVPRSCPLVARQEVPGGHEALSLSRGLAESRGAARGKGGRVVRSRVTGAATVLWNAPFPRRGPPAVIWRFSVTLAFARDFPYLSVAPRAEPLVNALAGQCVGLPPPCRERLA